MNFKFRNIILAFLITITPVIILSIPIIINYDKTASNSYLLTKDYSHFSRSEIHQHIDKDFTLPSQLELSLDDQDFTLPLASFSASINSQKTASSMLYRRFSEGIINYIKHFFTTKEYHLVIDFDNNLLDEEIAKISEQTDQPFIPTEIKLDHGQIITSNGSLGLELDKDLLKNQIIKNLTSSNFNNPIILSTKVVGYIPDQETLDSVITQAEKIIKKEIILSHEFEKISIDDTTIITWLGFENEFQTNKINDYVQALSKSLEREAINAVFKFENNKVLEFQPDRPGISVKEEELIELIENSINQLVSSSDKSFTIKIPVNTVEAIIKNDDVNDLGIKELLGRGTSTFKHSSSIRNQNIAKGSSIINRILVAPEETFSFVKSLGEVSLAVGYKKAYIIRQGRTELDVGGGICQVSTTFFRAMLDSGLDITARKAHAFRVSYYEEDSKPGFDATVFIPKPDLKFINDTGNYLLIQSIFDLDNRRLSYEIYGTSDGRQTEITNYRQWGYQPAPPDVWIDDPTLSPGQVVRDEYAVPGLKTAFDWEVKDKQGNTIHQKTFQSSFVPWAAVFRKGI